MDFVGQAIINLERKLNDLAYANDLGVYSHNAIEDYAARQFEALEETIIDTLRYRKLDSNVHVRLTHLTNTLERSLQKKISLFKYFPWRFFSFLCVIAIVASLVFLRGGWRSKIIFIVTILAWFVLCMLAMFISPCLYRFSNWDVGLEFIGGNSCLRKLFIRKASPENLNYYDGEMMRDIPVSCLKRGMYNDLAAPLATRVRIGGYGAMLKFPRYGLGLELDVCVPGGETDDYNLRMQFWYMWIQQKKEESLRRLCV